MEEARALLSTRLGFFGASLIGVSFGLYWGITLREEAHLKKKEERRLEQIIQERVLQATSDSKPPTAKQSKSK